MPSLDRLALVRTTVDDEAKAKQLARRLVDERLAACVHVQPVTSAYRWEGAVKQEDEFLLEARVPVASVPALRKRILALHPYDIPLLEVLEASGVPPSYLDWALAAVKPASP